MNDADPPTPRQRYGKALARLSLTIGLGCAAAALLAGPAYRIEWWSLATSLRTLAGAVMVAGGGTVIGLLAVALLLPGGRRRGTATAMLAVLVNLLVVLPPLLFYRATADLPPIHDISTDTADPPRFVDIVPLRSGAPNGLDYPAENARLQREAYPEIKSFTMATPPQKSFDRAARAAGAMGWEIVTIAPDELRIEATATSFYFGFKDDVVIRVAPSEAGSRIDVRSVSRVGRADFGTNAKRIRDYFSKLKAS
ncbi:DUF1499 domain-containing protein [Piscinibacter sakaiensis]|uniref:DUF1499 domain-containing protein n=1 Tax=Piscinibacter sakaiensis TaxID=1547922 RepID=UPI003AAC8258